MGNTVVGILLIVIGFVALMGGIAGGIAKMFKEIQNQVKKGVVGSALTNLLPTDLIKALTGFVKALSEAPQWLALVMIGMLLIGWGAAYL